MNARKKTKMMLLAGGLLIASIACTTSIPFLDSVLEPPTQEVDPNALATMVAESVAAKVTQTLQAMPLANEPEPPPMEISTSLPPTEIPPTIEPTLTPTPTPTEGTSLSELEEDDVMLFTDYSVGYKLAVPLDWLSLRVHEQEFLDAWLLPEATNPAVQQSLTNIQEMDPSEVRLVALDLREAHLINDFVTNINLMWDEQNNFILEDTMQQSLNELPLIIPGVRIVSSQFSETSAGIPIGVIISEWDTQTSAGGNIRIRQKQVFFRPTVGTLVATLTTSTDLNDAIVPEFDTMVDEIKLLDD